MHRQFQRPFGRAQRGHGDKHAADLQKFQQQLRPHARVPEHVLHRHRDIFKNQHIVRAADAPHGVG